MEFHFSTTVAARLAGATERQLGSWAKTGLVRPSGRDAAGSGTRRKYTFQDVVALKTIVNLRGHGVSIQKIRKAVTCLKDYFTKNDPSETNSAILSRLLLLTDGSSVFIYTNRNQVMDALTRQNAWSVVCVGHLINEARDAILRLDEEVEHEFSHAGQVYHLIITPDPDTGTYVSQCRELPGAIEQGHTTEEAIKNGMEAVRSALAFMAKRQRGRDARHVKTG
ncbi:MAG: hypothetical protein AMXMBFR13_38920 [Phycisphaerae bacterium]